MDRNTVFLTLAQMDDPKVNGLTNRELLIFTIAVIAGKISIDEMHGLLFIGAYLFHCKDGNDGEQKHLGAARERWLQ